MAYSPDPFGAPRSALAGLVPSMAGAGLRIPATTEMLTGTLNGVIGMIAKGGWFTAAAVYAWTEPGKPHFASGEKSPDDRLTIAAFAAFGIRGLSSRDTVRKFRSAWARAIERGWADPVKPGDPVRLPDQDFNLDEREDRVRPLVQPALLPAGMYDTILADPPWRYEFTVTPSRAIENQYPTLPVEAICDYHDDAGRSIREVIADDAVLFLWATNPLLPEALRVVEAWGFEYVTNVVWIKNKIGMGYWVRAQHELLLIGRRGNVLAPEPARRRSSVIEAPRRGHSVKPDEAYDLIESMLPKGKWLECFARRGRSGWTAFGNAPIPCPSAMSGRPARRAGP